MEKYLRYKDYIGSVDFDLEDNLLHGEILYIQDIVAYEGQTPCEVEGSFKNAVDEYIAYCEEVGQEPNKPYSGTTQVRMPQQMHYEVACAFKELGMKSINEYIVTSIEEKLRGPTLHHHQHQHTHLDFTINQDNTDPIKTVWKSREAGMKWPTELIH